MLTVLLLLAIFFGLIQELRMPSRIRIASFNYRSRKQPAKRSAFVPVSDKPKN
jgi:hypothetical protein